MKQKEQITLDIECYCNYLLVMFKRVRDGQVISYEKFENSDLDTKSIHHILNKYLIITFNGNFYDICILEAALSGYSNEKIHEVSKALIDERMQPWQVRKQFGFRALKDIDTIDIISVMPLKASLKIYGGRLGAPTLQDLPIDPYQKIRNDQRPLMIKYCGNDLSLTQYCLEAIAGEIKLRGEMSKEYETDLRSKSDAQIAEAVISHEFQRLTGYKPNKVKIPSGTTFKFNPPASLKFKTEQLQDIFKQYCELPYWVEPSGHVGFKFKDGKTKLKFELGESTYTLGVGGIHSNEKKKTHIAEGDIILRDYDVASYYPNIILVNKLFPKTLGEIFLKVYKNIVDRRLKAKAEKNKIVNESLKIVINGTFGKLASKYSFLYAPDLMVHVTVIGQLSLLMLIESIELAGGRVISGNTDGIVVKMDKKLANKIDDIVSDWEFETGYEMESTDYLKLCSASVNAYIAVKDLTEDGVKSKGAYAEPSLKINPSTDICNHAVKLFIQKDIPIEETINNCKDIKKFVVVRTVNGGAIHNGVLLGKAIRWYYSVNELDAIYYSTNGNKVPKSDGGKPCMVLPKEFPTDIDYGWYYQKAKTILKELGYPLKAGK